MYTNLLYSRTWIQPSDSWVKKHFCKKITVPSKTIIYQIQLANMIPPVNTAIHKTPSEEQEEDAPCIPDHLDFGELTTWTKE